MTRHLRVEVVMTLAVAAFGAEAAVAQDCRLGEAEVSVSGGTAGVVESHHFGRNTKFECFARRNMALDTEVHRDSQTVVDTVITGELEYLGGSMTKDYSFQDCFGKWDGSTRFGTITLGSFAMLDFATSGILFASCPPQRDRDPGPCSAGFEDTSTWAFGAEGLRLADHQLGYGLWRFQERPEGFYLLDEWTLLAFRGDRPLTRLSSTRAFKERVAAVAGAFRAPLEKSSIQDLAATADDPAPRKAANTRSLILVVEAGNHPHNHRHVTAPTFVPMEVDLSDVAKAYGRDIGGEFWFRAEVAPTGEVDGLIILESSVPIAEQYLHNAIRQHLGLRHETDRRHRVVVFGFARVGESGLLAVRDAMVVTPQCCCSSDPEAPPCM